MKADPFQKFRTSVAGLYEATTAQDGRTLSLVAIDAAHFHSTAHQVVELANRIGWRVTRLHRSGPNAERLTVAPHR